MGKFDKTSDEFLKEYSKNYGKPTSLLLQDLIKAGHKPIGITVMLCEETFIFQREEEIGPAIESIKDKWGNEGWWYAIEDDGDYPWEKTWDDYIATVIKSDEKHIPQVYWLNK